MGCRARQYSDEMVCHECGLLWDKNDPEPPACGKGAKETRCATPSAGATSPELSYDNMLLNRIENLFGKIANAMSHPPFTRHARDIVTALPQHRHETALQESLDILMNIRDELRDRKLRAKQ
mgnify:CR=1 FL=1